MNKNHTSFTEVLMKNILICIFILFTSPLFSEKANLKIILQDGIEYTESFEKDSKVITLVSKGDLRLKYLEDIQGFEQFENLTDFCMYFFNYKGDYSFLKSIKNLKDLSLMGSGAESLSFITDLELLEVVELQLDFRNEIIDIIEKKEVDLRKLKNLKKITIDNQMNHIPPFVNVKNKPLLLLDTTEIKKLSRKDYKYAKQYSSVRSLNPNPRWPFD